MPAAESRSVPDAWKTPWGAVMAALGLSLAGTVVLGGLLFLLQQNVWWIALGGILSIFGGGTYLGRRTAVAEPLYGVLLATGYFGIAVGLLFAGTLVEALPDPLPGLGIGDSTFFFVWPLLQLTAAVCGTVASGRWGLRNGVRGNPETTEDR